MARRSVSVRNETTGHGKAVLSEDGVEFDARDAALLRTIGRSGSIAAATADLERSRARALARIETLEAAFGDLVDRTRGGQGGGGSQLTENARTLLARYERLRAALTAAAQVPETVIEGVVTGTSGEIVTVETSIGDVCGLGGDVTIDDRVQLRIGADAVTLSAITETPEPDATSARNQVDGRVTAVERGETIRTIHVDVDGATFRVLVTAESVSRLDLSVGRSVCLTWKATATRVVPFRPEVNRGPATNASSKPK
ncbi:TOBE domain-containing protein [Halopenitus sp. H-Gu1]|uniref:TOBE domain-containing protein n=1 Tax=Halopenitus sp. H-Gu1 TaxID=3242697 RepID=UPI00359DBE37